MPPRTPPRLPGRTGAAIRIPAAELGHSSLGSRTSRDEAAARPGVAAGLAVAASTAYALIDRGDLPHVRFGRAIRVREDDLQAYVERESAGRGPGTTEGQGGRGSSLYRRTCLGPDGKPYLRWVAQISLGGRDDRRIVRRICPSKQDAKAALADLLHPAEPVPPQREQPLGAYLRRWLDETAAPSLRPNTCAAIAMPSPISRPSPTSRSARSSPRTSSAPWRA